MFKTPLQVEAVPPNLWKLLSTLVWEDEIEFGRVEFEEGLLTDLASTPQRLRRHKSFDPTGPSRRPAVGHDALYQRGTLRGKAITREQADRFFYVALRAEGVSMGLAVVFWLGVRIGGGAAWEGYRTAEHSRVFLP